MNNDTVNETWIDKLVDELVDSKNEISDLRADRSNVDLFTTMILNNVGLNYAGDGLRLESDTGILEYLRALYPSSYERKLKELQAEREAEIKKLAEAKAKESKAKKEA